MTPGLDRNQHPWASAEVFSG